VKVTADVKPATAVMYSAVVHAGAAVETTTAAVETTTAAVETTATAVETTATAAVPSSGMLSKCGFRRTSERNKCKGWKQDFGERGFSHFDSSTEGLEGASGGTAFVVG
jgi:hypothetical protein